MKHSPLDEAHRALGAKLVPFGGWKMPLAYADGTVAEHKACRTGAVAFDVSHLGTVRLTGGDAFDRLQTTLTNDLHRIGPGKAQYTHLLDGDDASVLDDIIVWWVDDERFDVIPNASNTDQVLEAIGGDDVTDTRAVVAIQGPEARDRLGEVSTDAAAVGRFCVGRFTWEGHDCVVAGTGYTGEAGVECAVPTEVASSFWSAVMDGGIEPAGLGARDTLRLEAGLPLHGHELGAGITPLQAGLGWVVRWDTEFRGKAALEAEKARGVARRIRGLRCEGRRPPRDGNPVLVGGAEVGVVTSGNFSPMLETGIAMAFLPPDVADGTSVEIDVRGKPVAAEVVSMPFWTR
ncbi:MAG: glycine cleavage system aminomethyltransferase GcvT [Acidimicrobiales bacterium]|nr:glycine cleavage system aminomethyltransferase GcvT [Acidimicrobiales bacterium]